MTTDDLTPEQRAAKEAAEQEVAERRTELEVRQALLDQRPGTGGEEPPTVGEPDLAPGMGGSIKQLLTENLFKDVKNSVLTVVFGALLAWITYKALFFVFDNTKVFDDGTVRSGWEIVREQLIVYMVGPDFLRGEVPLSFVWIGIWLIALSIGLMIGAGFDPDAPPMRPGTAFGLFGVPAIGTVAILSMTTTITPTLCVLATLVALEGARRGQRLVPDNLRGRVALLALPLFMLAISFWAGFSLDNTQSWGGVLLTFAAASISIIACFPIGVIMALGRRSSFPLIRPFAVGYIELIRGVPLISLLFLGQFALGFLLPEGMEDPADIVKAIIMITLFSGAYVAEIVRGGLQSVPGGQVEAGQAVGLQPLTITGRIVLPQALRNSIPPLIGQFISLLKDTTLLFIISQREILGAAAQVLGLEQYRFQGFGPEAFGFVAFVFWVICFTMSRASQRLETRLGVNKR